MADFPSTPKPEYVWEEVSEYRTVIHEAENGSEQRDKKWSAKRRHFKLIYRYQDAATIWTFADSKNGMATSFTFDPNIFLPAIYSAGNITVRFASDNIGRKIDATDLYLIEFELVEVK